MHLPSSDSVYNVAYYVFGPAIYGVVAYFIARRQGQQPTPIRQVDTSVPTLTRSTESDRLINEQLAVLLDRIRADRCYVTKFHNGEHFVDGSDLLKKSRTHEVIRPISGLSYQEDVFKNIIVSSQPEEMELLLQAGPSFRLVSDIRPSKFRWLCENGGVKAVARVGIYKNGSPIGFVGADFVSPKEPANIGELMKFTKQIQGLLQS